MRSKLAFLRQLIVAGFVYDVDYSYFREYNYLLRKSVKSERKCIAKKRIMCYDTHIAMRGAALRHTIFDSKIRRSERLTLERNVEFSVHTGLPAKISFMLGFDVENE